MRAISTLSTPQRVEPSGAAGVAGCAAHDGRARSRQAAFVPPKPRDSSSAMSLRGARCSRAAFSGAHAGSSSVSGAMPGTTLARSAASPIDGFDQSGGGQQVAEGPFERRDRRHVGRQTREPALAPPKHPSSAVPLPCAMIMPTSAGREVGRRQRSFDRAHQAVAVVADGQQAQSVAAAAGTEEFAEGRGTALLRGRLGFEHDGGGAFAHHAAVMTEIERPQRFTRQQTHLVVVEQGLRLDLGIVCGSHGARAFAGAQGFGRFGECQRAADAVIGDAGVRALEAVADADVAEHVVRQRAQQPHRIDGRRQFAAESLCRPPPDAAISGR